MIHATIHGHLVEDANYLPPRRDATRSRQAIVSFTVTTRRYGAPLHVECRLRGRRATDVERHLVSGRRVVVAGELRLVSGPRLLLEGELLELVGGVSSYRSPNVLGFDEDEDAPV